MHRLSAAVLALCVVLLASRESAAQLCSQHTFIGDSPSHGQPGWNTEAQWLAHDRDYWFVTQNNNDSPPTEALLWRIPVTTDFAADVSCGSGGVSCSRLSDLGLHPPYNHYGDPDVYEVNGLGYVLVPLKGDASVPNGLLIFRADETLELLTFTPFPGQTSSAWVAVDREGILYSSEFDRHDAVINRFYLDGGAFQANEHVPPTLISVGPLLAQDETGAPLDLHKAQGGEFPDDGRRFYSSNGDGKDDAEPNEGVHVFHPSADGGQCAPLSDECIARRIEHSHNSSDPGFAFEFNPGVPTFQEPEGLTFRDLDADGRAPGLGGQLHVVLLDNDAPGADEVELVRDAPLEVGFRLSNRRKGVRHGNSPTVSKWAVPLVLVP